MGAFSLFLHSIGDAPPQAGDCFRRTRVIKVFPSPRSAGVAPQLGTVFKHSKPGGDFQSAEARAVR